MDNFDKILEKIETQNIEPTPRWYFQFKNLAFWSVFLISIFIGSVAFSIILYSVQQTDFVLISHLKHSKMESFLVLLPYFWLILLLVFSLLAFFSFKNFKKAYKYSLVSILSLSVFLSIILGCLTFISGGAQFLERKFADKIEIYNSIEEKKIQHWMQPDSGFLAGTILEVKMDTLVLEDFNQIKWQIYFKDVFIPPVIEITEGEQIKILGKKTDDNIFEASEIRPWRAFGKSNQHGRKNKK